ncbi:Histidine phosphotransferase C-terminal domain [Candidatus Bealeia paramacronuclearis]|uniref:Histidine phosphotransferase C-terminal domain n=1 Tax=Candidatus Bealeia paramacronuclearis TaxID=1921001 RepID=A0ABZ2C0Q0_9PROT|nr:hypothetical protein [Candidatus Bealeia paramacronuclearis]
MRDEKLIFAELLCSRLCHDLITPVGAINTGLELFDEHAGGKSGDSEEILNLIRQSAIAASSRLSFYRAAFGSSGGGIALGDVKRHVERFFTPSKLTFSWEEPFEPNLNIPQWGRLLLNIVLWINECAPRGGELKIKVPQEHHLCAEIELEGDHITVSPDGKSALLGEAPLKDLTPRTIQPYLLSLLGKSANVVFEITQTNARRIVFVAKKKT